MTIENYYFDYQSHHNLTFPTGLHSHYEIIAVSEGEMNVIINRTKIALSAGRGVFLPGYINHGFETLENSKCHIWEYDSNLISEEFSSKICTFDFPISTMIFLDNIYEPKNNLICKSTIYLIASYICSNTAKIHNIEQDDITSRAALFIAENCNKNITLQDAAEFCNVSYTYLSKIFRKNIGISFTNCLNNTRISKCQYLLSSTNLPITDIALSCGFNTIRNFNRIFSEQLGCTPQEYRNQFKISINIGK